MNTALTLFWIVSGLSFAVGGVMTVIGLLRAPEGVEDEHGFRYLHSADAHETPDTQVHHGNAELA
jgi:hypothetical protein